MVNLKYNLDGPVAWREIGDEEGRPVVPGSVAGEESMLANSITFEKPDMRSYEDLKKEFMLNGTSELTEGIKERAAQDLNREMIDRELQKQADGLQTIEETEFNLANTAAVAPEQITDLHRELARARLLMNNAKTEQEKLRAQLKWQELVAGGKVSPEIAIEERLTHIMSEMDPDAMKLLGGMLADAIPFVSTVAFKQAFDEVFPEDIDWGDLPRGEMAMEFRRRLMAVEPEERFRLASKFMDAVVGNDSYVTSSQWQQIMILEEALRPDMYEEGFAGINWDRVIGNAITVLDTAALGGLGRALMKLGKKQFTPGTVLSTANKADQELAAELAAAGIKKDLNDALGMTPAEITEQAVVPAPYMQQAELLPPDILHMIDTNKQSTRDLLERTRGNALLVSDAEADEALRALRTQLNTVNTAGLYESNITMARTDTGVVYTATYGRVNSDAKIVAFASPREAAEHAAAQFPSAKKVWIQKVKADGSLGKPMKPGKNTFKDSKAKGEFVYTIEDSRQFADIEFPSNKLFFPEGSVKASGTFAKYFFDPASRFANWISRSFSQAGDLGRGVQHQLTQMVEPFTKISNAKKAQVMKLLKEYEKAPGDFDTAKLMQMAGNDPDVVKGFIAYRNADEALYELEARNFRNDLVRQGTKAINAGEYSGMGVKMSDGGLFDELAKHGDSLEVWDPIKNTFKTFTTRQMQRYRSKGGSIYRVVEPKGHPNRQTNLVMVTNEKQIGEIPLHPLNRREGHIARYYKDVYFIRRNVQGKMNGANATTRQVLGVAKNKAEANDFVAQLVRDGKVKPDEVKILHDRNMTPAERSEIDLQDKISLGRMFYHKRAENVLPGIDGLADVADPVESLIRNIDSTSRYVAEGDLLHMMKTRWMNTYGHLTKNNVFPMSTTDIAAIPFADDVSRKHAKELWDQIRNAESINTREGEIWRDSIMGVVDWFIGSKTGIRGKLAAAVTEPLRWFAENSPNKILRSFAFWHLIAGNPIRQIYVQSQQFMFLSAINPVLGAKVMFKDGPAAMLGFLARDTNPGVYKAMKPIWAKALGMSTKEYDKFIDGYVKTGLPHSVDSHDYVSNILATYSKNISGGALKRAGRTFFNFAQTPLRWAKTVGFDMGELSNLTNTFMFARARYLKSTGKKQLTTRKDFDTVAANARNLALDMTHTGAFRYQDGAFSALTQFLAIQHKAFLAMNPFKYGNQAFTTWERARIAFGQVILNGATGVGLYEMYRKARDELGLEIPDEAEDYIVGGLYETFINASIAAATGEEEQDFNIAGNIAPFSGINTDGILDTLLGNKSMVDMMASMNVVNRYTDMARTMKAMWDYPELTGDRQLLAMLENFSSVFSGANQALRARAAHRLGIHVSNKGSPTVQATYNSMLMEGALGLQLRDVDNLYDLMKEFGADMKDTSTPLDRDKELQQQADNLYNQTLRIVTIFGEEMEFKDELGTSDQAKLEQMQIDRMNKQLSTIWSVNSLWDPIDRDRIWELVTRKALTDRTQGRKNIIDGILSLVARGDIPAHDANYVINRVRNAQLWTAGTPEAEVWEDNIKTILENLTLKREFSIQNSKDLENILNGRTTR